MKILVFTDSDLDGAGSALFIKWLFKSKLSYFDIVETMETVFHNDFNDKAQTLDSYDKVFILDLDLTEAQIKLVDKSNVVVIDHHTPHVSKRGLYQHAKPIIEEIYVRATVETKWSHLLCGHLMPVSCLPNTNFL